MGGLRSFRSLESSNCSSVDGYQVRTSWPSGQWPHRARQEGGRSSLLTQPPFALLPRGQGRSVVVWGMLDSWTLLDAPPHPFHKPLIHLSHYKAAEALSRGRGASSAKRRPPPHHHSSGPTFPAWGRQWGEMRYTERRWVWASCPTVGYGGHGESKHFTQKGKIFY